MALCPTGDLTQTTAAFIWGLTKGMSCAERKRSKLGHLRATNKSRKPDQAHITRGDPALLTDAEKCSGNWRNFNKCCNLIVMG